MFKQISVKFRLRLALAVLALALLFPTGLFQFPPSWTAPAHAGLFNSDLETLENVLDLVADKYVYPPNYKKIFSAGIAGMIEFIDPDNKKFKATPEGAVLDGKTDDPLYQLDFSRSRNMRVFNRVYYALYDSFEDKTDKWELEKAGINGMIDALDPYSQFLDKKAFEKSMSDTEGKYGGLGMVITMKDYNLTVVKTMKNSPARRAKILPDDRIVKIDGKSVKGLQLVELADRLRGYPNTQVRVGMYRPKDKTERSLELTREIISVETVTGRMLENRTAYVRVSSFSKNTDKQLKKELERFRQNGAKAVILDLRDNPGGLLQQSVKVAGHFLKKDTLVVYTQGREKEDQEQFHSRDDESYSTLPVAALINHFSASASEIVAGSLKDSGNALILGENSYGKGSVQTIFRINDGAGLRLTTSKYYTPSGIDITKNGIVPHIRVLPDLPANGDKGEAADKTDESAIDSETVLKRLEMERYLKEKGYKKEEGTDSLIQFASLVLREGPPGNKKQTVQKARELAANIQY